MAAAPLIFGDCDVGRLLLEAVDDCEDSKQAEASGSHAEHAQQLGCEQRGLTLDIANRSCIAPVESV